MIVIDVKVTGSNIKVTGSNVKVTGSNVKDTGSNVKVTRSNVNVTVTVSTNLFSLDIRKYVPTLARLIFLDI